MAQGPSLLAGEARLPDLLCGDSLFLLLMHPQHRSYVWPSDPPCDCDSGLRRGDAWATPQARAAGQPPLVQPKKRTVLQQKTRADQHEQIESRKEAQNRVHAAHPGTAAAICRYRPNCFHFRTLHRSRRSLIAFLTQAIHLLLANYL